MHIFDHSVSICVCLCWSNNCFDRMLNSNTYPIVSVIWTCSKIHIKIRKPNKMSRKFLFYSKTKCVNFSFCQNNYITSIICVCVCAWVFVCVCVWLIINGGNRGLMGGTDFVLVNIRYKYVYVICIYLSYNRCIYLWYVCMNTYLYIYVYILYKCMFNTMYFMQIINYNTV